MAFAKMNICSVKCGTVGVKQKHYQTPFVLIATTNFDEKHKIGANHAEIQIMSY